MTRLQYLDGLFADFARQRDRYLLLRREVYKVKLLLSLYRKQIDLTEEFLKTWGER